MEVDEMFTLKHIASAIGGEVVGNGEREILCVSRPEDGSRESIVFIRDEKTFENMRGSRDSAYVLCFHPDEGEDMDYILVDSDRREEVFIALLSLFEEKRDFGSGISQHAIIDPDAELGSDVVVDAGAVVGKSIIGDGAHIGANTVIGKNVKIGVGCILFPCVTIYPGTIIEDNVIVHSGVVIGADGYGYSRIEGSHRKIPQIGGVYIGRDVEIGANTTIDRATLGMTEIGAGTKIDNLVQIGHNVEIGEHCIVVGLCGIAGSAKLGNNVVVAGMVGITDHAEIGDNAYLLAKSGIMARGVKSGTMVAGYPAMDLKEVKEFWAMRPRIRGMYRDLQKIKKKIDIDED
jgi:UDP-3-O-[3-hydroxymyristoyl] glucosamine N-acyltransferase